MNITSKIVRRTGVNQCAVVLNHTRTYLVSARKGDEFTTCAETSLRHSVFPTVRSLHEWAGYFSMSIHRFHP
jgi:hypothetical protein